MQAANASSGVSDDNRLVENPSLVKLEAERQRIAGIIQVVFAAIQAGRSVKAALQVGKTGIGGFKPSQLMDNALLKFNQEGLTNAGRALSKHPAIIGESKQTFNTVYRTVEAQNKDASNFLNNLLKEGNGAVIDNTRWGKLIEYRNSSGLGARWTTDGKFIGFVD